MPTVTHAADMRAIVAVHEDAVRDFLLENLTADGYAPLAATNVRHATCRLADHPDAAILHLGPDTLELLRSIRNGSLANVDPGLPVLTLTGSPGAVCRVRLLENGANDVLSVPFSYPELRARLAGLLRPAGGTPRELVRVGRLRVDLAARRVWVGDTEVRLTGREFALLRTLLSDPGRVFTRAELLETVWGVCGWAQTRTLDTHACRLRRKLSGQGARFIVSCWGEGYRLIDAALA